MLQKEQFIFVRYNGVPYPFGYASEICEVSAHFDKSDIEEADKYSLHTEYSYGKRKFDTQLIASYPALQEAHRNGVPQLWKSDEWADSFADFLLKLTEGRNPPEIIEIHPPFNDYCSLDEFVERFFRFEERIHSVYPDTHIFLENRAGTIYRGGRFLIGKAKEIVGLCEVIIERKLNLGIVLDFSQLLTAENIDSIKFKPEKYQLAINALSAYKSIIKGIHIWGKKKSTTGRWVAHCGNLNTYFSENEEVKRLFISGIEQICNDGRTRFLVPEVNSGADDLALIMAELFKEE